MEPAREAVNTPFMRFSYAYSEISVVGGRAHVKSRRASLANGKLESESFEGDVDRGVYDQAVAQAERYFADQTELFLRSLSMLLPWRR